MPLPRPRFTARQLRELGPGAIGEDSVSLTLSETDLDEDAGGLTDADYTVGGVLLPLKVKRVRFREPPWDLMLYVVLLLISKITPPESWVISPPPE